MKVTEEERKNIEESIKKEKTNKYDLCLGFTKLWKDVIAAKKIMVGHNCFADLTFLFSHLVDTPPISYEEFKLEILKRVGRYK
jgi:poly(A)-specific ribonuclease